MHDRARHWLQQITALPLAAPVRIMNVCGGHERAIALAGLRSLLPPAVQLIPGPGCPVCICPEEDIRQAIDWALHHEVIIASFGDMLRVPVNLPRGEVNSLTAAKAAGADVRAIAAPTEAIRIASENPARTVVLHAVGFETTMAPIAALIGQGLPANLLILASGRRTWPAVAMLLDSPDAGLDALIAPGHVATVMAGAVELRRLLHGEGDFSAHAAEINRQENVADEIMRMHFENKVGLVPLCRSAHKLVHSGALTVHPLMVHGSWLDFLRDYSDGVNEEIVAQLLAFLQVDEEAVARAAVKIDGRQAQPRLRDDASVPTRDQVNLLLMAPAGA